uniref:Uncharacterized protein n=1 Tax=Lepeophtheirus salmonis TaxID=72036 RepID=A0A0K2UQ61_LEPSM
MSGCNYYITIRQLLQSEKAIRLRAIVKYTSLSIRDLKQTLEEAIKIDESKCMGDIAVFLDIWMTWYNRRRI